MRSNFCGLYLELQVEVSHRCPSLEQILILFSNSFSFSKLCRLYLNTQGLKVFPECLYFNMRRVLSQTRSLSDGETNISLQRATSIIQTAEATWIWNSFSIFSSTTNWVILNFRLSFAISIIIQFHCAQNDVALCDEKHFCGKLCTQTAASGNKRYRIYSIIGQRLPSKAKLHIWCLLETCMRLLNYTDEKPNENKHQTVLNPPVLLT